MGTAHGRDKHSVVSCDSIVTIPASGPGPRGLGPSIRFFFPYRGGVVRGNRRRRDYCARRSRTSCTMLAIATIGQHTSATHTLMLRSPFDKS